MLKKDMKPISVGQVYQYFSPENDEMYVIIKSANTKYVMGKWVFIKHNHIDAHQHLEMTRYQWEHAHVTLVTDQQTINMVKAAFV